MTDVTCFIEHVSWRNSVNGAWFIEALCQVLEDHGQEKNLLWMITKVSRIVATQKETLDGKKQMPCVVSLLTRDLRFLPKTIQPLSLYNV
jgi:caspase 7